MGLWAGFGPQWAALRERRIDTINKAAEKRYDWAASYGKQALTNLQGKATESRGHLDTLYSYGFSDKAADGMLETGGLDKLKEVADRLDKSRDWLQAGEIKEIIKQAESWSTSKGELNKDAMIEKINRGLNLYKRPESDTTIDKNDNIMAAILGYGSSGTSQDDSIDIGGYNYEQLRELSVAPINTGGSGSKRFVWPSKPQDLPSMKYIKTNFETEIIPIRIDAQIKRLMMLSNAIVPQGDNDTLTDTQRAKKTEYTRKIDKLEGINKGSLGVSEKILAYSKVAPTDLFFFTQLQDLEAGVPGSINKNVYMRNSASMLKEKVDELISTNRSYSTAEEFEAIRATVPAGAVLIAGRIQYHDGR